MSGPERIHTGRVLVVEGKYDAARLARLTDAMILLTDGFAIFSDKKRQRLLKELAVKNGLLLLTDSDKAGFQIRTYITNLVGAEHVAQAYVPALPGKERRKALPGKEGLLGVEGVPDELVRKSLLDALGPEAGRTAPPAAGRPITYSDLYDWACRARPARQSANTACWRRSACRRAFPKRKCWKFSTGCIPSSSWMSCSKPQNRHKTANRSP